MSGLGIVVRWGGTPDPVSGEAISSGIAHRGSHAPTRVANGPAALVHAQLPTTTEALRERQPLRHATRAWWLVADARIDNREDLVGELGTDLDQSCDTDAEFILAAYERWGDELGRHLLGDFAIAIWDAERQAVVLCRDHIGIRPLFWAIRDGQVIAASTVRAVADALPRPLEMDRRFLARYATAARDDVTGTPWQGVERVPPATTIVVGSDGVLARETFWSVFDIPVVEGEPAPEGLRAAFDAAVACRLRTVGNVGVELSGGYDSTTVAATARAIATSAITAFSLVFPGSECDESAYVDAAREALGLEVVKLDALHQEVYDFLGQCRRDRTLPPTPDQRWDEPLARSAAAHGCEVVLTGQGGDQLLTGTPDDDVVDALLRWRPVVAWSALQGWAPTRRDHARDFGRAIVKTAMLRVERWGPWARPLQLPITGRRRRHSRQRQAFLGPLLRGALGTPFDAVDLPSLSSYADHERRTNYVSMSAVFSDLWDRTGAVAGIEYRHPFLDVRLIELALRVPAGRLTQHGDDRALHKVLFGDRLPAIVRQREDKADFSEPWIGSGLTVARRLNGHAASQPGLVDLAQWRRATTALEAGDLDSVDMWTWWGATSVLALVAAEAERA